MPLSKIFSASTSNAIFWQSTLAPCFPVPREGKSSFGYNRPSLLCEKYFKGTPRRGSPSVRPSVRPAAAAVAAAGEPDVVVVVVEQPHQLQPPPYWKALISSAAAAAAEEVAAQWLQTRKQNILDRRSRSLDHFAICLKISQPLIHPMFYHFRKLGGEVVFIGRLDGSSLLVRLSIRPICRLPLSVPLPPAASPPYSFSSILFRRNDVVLP